MAAMKDPTSPTVSIFFFYFIPLVAETRGSLSHNIRGLTNLCATLAESSAVSGFNPKLKAES
jgi:hypothetical protein